MKTNSIFLLSLFFTFTGLASHAQTISRSVIGSTGSNNEQMSFTVGETVIEMGDSPDIILTQGFQQPETLTGTFVDPILGEATFVLYPNPTQEKLILKIETEKSRTLSVGFSDIRGRRILLDKEVKVGQNLEHDFDVSSFAEGNYLLLLKNEQGKVLKSFRFQKSY